MSVPPLLKAILGVGVWLLVGTFWYAVVANNCFEESVCEGNETVTETTSCGWTLALSFYYSVQTGMNIGYGLVSETNDVSRLYSIIHMLCGASLVAGALSVFTTLVLAGHEGDFLSQQEKKLAKFAQHMKIDGMSAMDLNHAKLLMAEFPQYQRDLYIKLEGSHNIPRVDLMMQVFEGANKTTRQELALAALTRASRELEEFKEHSVVIQDLAKLHAESQNLARKIIVTLTKSRQTWVPLVTLIIFLSAGTIWGVTSCGWTFITGLYFAVSGLSTAGLQASCNTDAGNVLFVGFFSLLGVPVFGAVLGFWSNQLIQPVLEKQSRQKLKERITSAEMEFVQHLLAHDHSDRLTLGEYIQIELLKLGATDRDTLTNVADHFKRLDKNNSGFISRSEAMKGSEAAVESVKKAEGLEWMKSAVTSDGATLLGTASTAVPAESVESAPSAEGGPQASQGGKEMKVSL